MKTFQKIVAALFLFLPWSSRAGAPVDWVARLGSPDAENRREAVDRIQTLDDPGIPKACLPLLEDQGMSIRRQAARAIGSRAREIPAALLPEFIDALRKYRDSLPAEAGDRLVAERALGLLTHTYSSHAFLVSPDKELVLYEQRRLPMISSPDLRWQQLLAPKIPPIPNASDFFAPADHVEHGELVSNDALPRTPILKLPVTNWSVKDLFDPHWSPDSAALEVQPHIMRRFFRPVCLWRRSDSSYRDFTVESFRKIYGHRFPHWATTLDFVAWKGPKAIFRIWDCDDGGGPPYDPVGILVSVNVTNWAISAERK